MPFYLSTENFPKSSFMNRNSFPEDWMHFSRIPNEYLLFIINDGILYISEDNTKYELHTGDMLLLEPGHFHVGYKKSFVDYYFIHMPSDTFQPINLETSNEIMNHFQQNKHNYYKSDPFSYELYDSLKPLIPKTMHIETSAFSHIRSKMEEVTLSLASRDEYYKLVCSKTILDILICLSRCYVTNITSEASTKEVSVKRDTRVENVLSFLQSFYQTRITGKDIEVQLHMNFDYLNRLFKTQIGMTIFEYLRILRINKAKEFLVNSNMKIFEIAALTGFPNEYHFNRVFTNVVGISPGKYRNII